MRDEVSEEGIPEIEQLTPIKQAWQWGNRAALQHGTYEVMGYTDDGGDIASGMHSSEPMCLCEVKECRRCKPS